MLLLATTAEDDSPDNTCLSEHFSGQMGILCFRLQLLFILMFAPIVNEY